MSKSSKSKQSSEDQRSSFNRSSEAQVGRSFWQRHWRAVASFAVVGLALTPSVMLFQNCAPGFEVETGSGSISKSSSVPTVEVISEVPALTNATNLSIEFSVQMAQGLSLRSLSCQVSGEATARDCSRRTLVIDPLEERAYQIRIRAVDSLGQLSEETVVGFTVDRTAPIVTLSSTPSAITNQTTAMFVFSAVDLGGTASELLRYECSRNGAQYLACTSPVSLTGLTQGPHRLQVRSTDLAGNTSQAADFQWSVDLQAPTVSIASYPGSTSGGFTVANSGSVVFSGMEGSTPLARYECALAPSTVYANCTSPYAVAALPQGVSTFRVRGYDRAGNVSAVATASWTVDNIPPSVPTISSTDFMENGNRATGRFTFTASDAGNGSGIASYECSLDSTTNFSSCTSPRELSNVANGQHVFRVRARDRAGNVSTVAQNTFRVDTVAPSVPVITSNRSNPTTERTARITFSSTDSGSGIDRYMCRLNSGSFAACTSPVELSNLAEQEHAYTVRAYDRAGNTVDGTYRWRVDTLVRYELADVTTSTFRIPCEARATAPEQYRDSSYLANFTSDKAVFQWTYHAPNCGAAEMVEYSEYRVDQWSFVPETTGTIVNWDRQLTAWIVKPLTAASANFLNASAVCGRTNYLAGGVYRLPLSCHPSRAAKEYFRSRLIAGPMTDSPRTVRMLPGDTNSGDGSNPDRRPTRYLTEDFNQRRAVARPAVDRINISTPTESVLATLALTQPTSSSNAIVIEAGAGWLLRDFQVRLRTDSKLVVENRATGQTVWESENAPLSPACTTCRLTYTPEGDLVIGTSSTVLWNLGSNTLKGKLEFSLTAPFVRVTDEVAPGRTVEMVRGDQLTQSRVEFSRGQFFLWSGSSRKFKDMRMAFEVDGNVVIYDKSNRPIWATNTRRNCPRLGCFMDFQADGNLVIYAGRAPASASTPVVWATGTVNSGVTKLVVDRNNGLDFVTLRNSGNTVIWPPYEAPGG